jgi:hypothetical protein
MDESATLSSYQTLKASTSNSGVTAIPAAEMDVEAEIVIGRRSNEDLEGEGEGEGDREGEGEGETRSRRRREEEVEAPMEEVQCYCYIAYKPVSCITYPSLHQWLKLKQRHICSICFQSLLD